MNSMVKASCVGVIALILFVVGSVFAVEPMAPAQTLNLPDAEMNNAVADDDVPDVTARVARISFIRGDVQIRRIGGQDWEKATLNLPVVEGDEITTNADARLEIQFSNYSHLRLAENSYLKVLTLQDEGIAVSLSQGTLNLRITEFDKDRSYFEIDAPKTTVAVQRPGMYRVDSGKQGDSEIRVSAGEDGEARVYSDNAGFTLKNGRSVRVFIDGVTAGEWETADAARYADEFDSWALDRDVAIAKHLKDAYYNKYYDNDIYGAEDLNDNGEWIHTSKYGYVWRPYKTTLSSYADWSPYRYGHWRWIPPYGWTWVNDEPWGWATYHHGRWLYDDGFWYWSPYGYYRNSRSWWFPALVVINIFGNNVCWYPLPYNYGYYNYNSYYYSHGGWGGHHNGNGGGHHQGGGVPTPSPTPVVAQNGPGLRKVKTPPLQGVPPTGVVTVAAGDFGTKIKGVKTAPLSMANSVLSKIPDDVKSPPVLPTYTALNDKISRDIKTERPQIVPANVQIKTGASTRKTDAPLDQELRNSRIFGNRPPLVTTSDQGGVRTINNGSSDTRKTGAVDRPPVMKQDRNENPVKQTTVYTPPIRVSEEPQNPPVKAPRNDPPPPRYDPPPKQETPRYDPPPTKQPPRNDPPPPKSEPKRDPTPPTDKSDGGKKKDG